MTEHHVSTEFDYTLTNAQAALMAAIKVEKNNGETYRYEGTRERVITERAAEFLAFLNEQDGVR